MSNKNSIFGLRALFRIYKMKLLLKGGIAPLVISIVFVVPILIFTEKDVIELVETVTSKILSIIPNLLGFVLSGYALLIGFGNITNIAKQKNKETTLYQKISTVFSVSLLMQMLLLIFAFVVKLALDAELYCSNVCYGNIVNYTVIILLIFGLLYVTFMIKDLVLIIFNYSQYQHYLINKKQDTDTK
jgi:hypothetical protein